MKTSILERLEALERAASQTAISRLRIIDLTQIPDEDRDAYWSGDVDVLNRYAPPIPDMPPRDHHDYRRQPERGIPDDLGSDPGNDRRRV